MKKLVVILVILLAPQLASARVYMCVDPETGKTSFTDGGCTRTAAAGEEVRVERANLTTGDRYGREARRKTWRSQDDTRKSGLEYNAERREIYENSATAAAD
jgi:hypothetical protein